MNCAKCGQLFCVCPAREQSAKPLPQPYTYHPLHEGEYLSKEEFGLNLYEAIQLIGGMLGLEQQRAAAIHAGHGYKIKGLLERHARLVKEWPTHLARLTYAERIQIIDRYPWVRDL